MKKIFVLLNCILAAFILPILFLVSSCGAQSWKTNIQFVFSPNSTLADNSFNENAFNGVSKFFKEKVYGNNWTGPNPNILMDKTSGVWRSSPGTSYADYIQTYRDAYASDAAMLICNGFWQVAPLQLLCCNEPLKNYPDWTSDLRNKLGVIYVDGELSNSFEGNECNPYNVAAVAYKVDDAAFWGGVLTGIELNENHYYQTVNASHYGYDGDAYLVGGYVGLPIPPTLAFLNGWCQGLNYFNTCLDTFNKAQPEAKFHPVIFISPTGKYDDINQFCSGSFSPIEEKAKTLTDKYLELGVSAILPVAGPQTAISVKEVVQRKSHAMVIGADTALDANWTVNMYNDIGEPIIPFSITKNLAQSIADLLNTITQQLNDQLQLIPNPNNKRLSSYNGFGYNNWATLDNGGVGLSYKQFQNGQVSKLTYQDIINQYLGRELNLPLPTPSELNQKLTGQEFNDIRSANVNGKSIITVPKISATDGSQNNTYSEPSEDKKPIANLDDINTFLKNFANKHSISDGKNIKKVNWYMQRT